MEPREYRFVAMVHRSAVKVARVRADSNELRMSLAPRDKFGHASSLNPNSVEITWHWRTKTVQESTDFYHSLFAADPYFIASDDQHEQHQRQHQNRDHEQNLAAPMLPLSERISARCYVTFHNDAADNAPSTIRLPGLDARFLSPKVFAIVSIPSFVHYWKGVELENSDGALEKEGRRTATIFCTHQQLSGRIEVKNRYIERIMLQVFSAVPQNSKTSGTTNNNNNQKITIDQAYVIVDSLVVAWSAQKVIEQKRVIKGWKPPRSILRSAEIFVITLLWHHTGMLMPSPDALDAWVWIGRDVARRPGSTTDIIQCVVRERAKNIIWEGREPAYFRYLFQQDEDDD